MLGAAGGASTVNAVVAGASEGTVTTSWTDPAFRPAGTVVVIEVPVFVDTVAAVPPMVTAAPARFAPEIVMAAPGAP